MRQSVLIALLLLLPALGWAQSGRTYGEIADDLYLKANDANRLKALADEAARSPEAYLVAIWQPGELLTAAGATRSVKGLRYNVAHQLLELQDSLGGFRVFPPGSLRGFTLGTGSQARRFRTMVCRGTRSPREFVEVLTTGDQKPLTVAYYHIFVDEPAEVHPVLGLVTRKARRLVTQSIVAGGGQQSKDPLQSLQLNKRAVLKLFGSRAKEVEDYATRKQLSFEQLPDVVQLADYFNTLP